MLTLTFGLMVRTRVEPSAWLATVEDGLARALRVLTPAMTRSLSMNVPPWQVPLTMRWAPGLAASTACWSRG